MKKITFLGIVIMLFVFVQSGIAGGKEDLKKYLNKTACKVKATTDLSEKREILNKSLQTMSKALDRLNSLPLISKEERSGINRFKSVVQEKQDELMGINGYQRVADAQLNDFSSYVVQDVEQATQTITVSVLSAVLIIVIIVLLLG